VFSIKTQQQQEKDLLILCQAAWCQNAICISCLL